MFFLSEQSYLTSPGSRGLSGVRNFENARNFETSFLSLQRRPASVLE